MKLSKLAQLVGIGVIALLVNPITLSLAMRSSFMSFQFDGTSMYPTIANGDLMLFRKFDKSLQRGDIVVLRNPGNESTLLVKRIVGMPGDRIAIQDGTVLIDGKKFAESYIPVRWHDERSEVRVRNDHYYVLGDNRDNSADSRTSQIGLIPAENILGVFEARYWPDPEWKWTLVAYFAAPPLLALAFAVLVARVAKKHARSAWYWPLGFVLLGIGLALTAALVARFGSVPKQQA